MAENQVKKILVVEDDQSLRSFIMNCRETRVLI